MNLGVLVFFSSSSVCLDSKHGEDRLELHPLSPQICLQTLLERTWSTIAQSTNNRTTGEIFLSPQILHPKTRRWILDWSSGDESCSYSTSPYLDRALRLWPGTHIRCSTWYATGLTALGKLLASISVDVLGLLHEYKEILISRFRPQSSR